MQGPYRCSIHVHLCKKPRQQRGDSFALARKALHYTNNDIHEPIKFPMHQFEEIKQETAVTHH